MKKKKMMIISAIALVVVAAVVLLFVGLRNRNCKYEELGTLKYVKFSNESGEYELVKEEECWYWKDRKDLLLEEVSIEALMALSQKELGLEKLEEKGSFKKYGLDDTEYSLTLQDSNGKKVTMYIGDMMGDDSYFVRVGNEKAIYRGSLKVMDVIDSLAAERNVSEQMEFIGEQ